MNINNYIKLANKAANLQINELKKIKKVFNKTFIQAVDVILNCRTPVHTYIDGSAASAATLISVVGDKRFIYEHSHMLIHQLSSAMWGKFEDFKDEMENLDLLMTKIKKIYKEKTNMSMRQITEILKRDKWFEAEKCVELGLVDEIVENG